MTNEDIDSGIVAVQELVRIGGNVYPPIRFAVPYINALLRYEGGKWKTGLAAGAIVSDGHGGFVPSSNSRFDPITGAFL